MGRALVNKDGGKLKKMIQSAPRMRGVTPVPNGPLIKKNGSALKKGGTIKKAQSGDKMTKDSSGYTYTKEVSRPEGKRYYQGSSPDQSMAMKLASFKARTNPSDSLRTSTIKKNKTGGKLKSKNKK